MATAAARSPKQSIIEYVLGVIDERVRAGEPVPDASKHTAGHIVAKKLGNDVFREPEGAQMLAYLYHSSNRAKREVEIHQTSGATPKSSPRHQFVQPGKSRVDPRGVESAMLETLWKIDKAGTLMALGDMQHAQLVYVRDQYAKRERTMGRRRKAFATLALKVTGTKRVRDVFSDKQAQQILGADEDVV